MYSGDELFVFPSVVPLVVLIWVFLEQPTPKYMSRLIIRRQIVIKGHVLA